MTTSYTSNDQHIDELALQLSDAIIATAQAERDGAESWQILVLELKRERIENKIRERVLRKLKVPLVRGLAGIS